MTKRIPLIGSDPEMFVARNGQPSSAIGLIGGSKNEPRRVNLGALQEDNVLLEFNIDPASNLEEFQRNIKAVLEQGRDSIRQYELDVQRKLSSHVYPLETLRSFGKPAFVFGCEPDFNAWTFQPNVMPKDVDPGLRTAGGHLHIGYGHLEEVTVETSEAIAQMCDFVLGLPSLLMDTDDMRRALYGKAGAIRYKSYGVEYRTLSNFWIWEDETLAWAYEGAVRAYTDRHLLDAYCDVISGDEVQRIINTNDKDGARQALEALKHVAA